MSAHQNLRLSSEADSQPRPKAAGTFNFQDWLSSCSGYAVQCSLLSTALALESSLFQHFCGGMLLLILQPAYHLFCGVPGAGFLMWELSTPFVYLRWFLHNLGYAKSPLYVANGFAMLISFFLARNVFGNCELPVPGPLPQLSLRLPIHMSSLHVRMQFATCATGSQQPWRACKRQASGQY